MNSIKISIEKSQRVADIKSCYCSFPYDKTWVEFFRSMTSRFYHSEGAHEKCWEIPSTRLNHVIKEAHRREIDIEIVYKDFKDTTTQELPAGFSFKTEPYQHQMEGLLYGLNHECFLLGDEQGLGKTKQVIDIACALRAQGKIKHALIICCDNGLKKNWAVEVEKHSNEKSLILGTRYTKREKKPVICGNRERYEDLCNIDNIEEFFLITNVESLRYVEKIPVGNPTKKGKQKFVKRFVTADKINELARANVIGLIAVDEIHKAKNPSSLQGEALLRIEHGRRIPMTGTPILNCATDCYVPMKLMGIVKDNFGLFQWRYAVKDGFGAIVGWKNMSELRDLISNHMLRRLKSDVLDLPPKVYTNYYVDILPAQKKIYDEVLSAIRKDIDLIRLSKNPLASLIRLRQATDWTGILSSTVQCSAKFEKVRDLVEEAVSSNAKCILFSNWTAVTQPLRAFLSNYNPAYITGEMSAEERFAQEQKFQTDDSCKICIGTIGAMGVGRTLTAANYVYFLDEPWNMGTKEQCADRAHRIGTVGTVNIGTLITTGTIDERIHEIVVQKGELADMLVDGRATKADKEFVLDYLLS